VTASAGLAADLGAPPPPPPAPPAGWIVTVKATGEVSPTFIGSDRYSFIGWPSLSFRRVGEPVRFSAPDDGVDFSLYDTSWFRIGPVARYRGGRYSGSEGRLTGLEDVKWSIEPGVFVELWPTDQIRARMEIRYGINGYNGFVGDVGLDFVQPYGRFTFAIGPRLAWGDTDFTRAFFGVTPLEASINGLVTPYRPTGGVTSVGVAGSIGYAWSDAWTTTLFGGYERLVSDAADSPIVKNLGSRDQFSVGLSLAYSFQFNGF
jgi:outer membrane scaffolding protein for murein synthesis (MipA/OmpV family)